ncbi:hypothetical protein P7C73_g4873, partial [Tremellales sp. Uapishka_1]
MFNAPRPTVPSMASSAFFNSTLSSNSNIDPLARSTPNPGPSSFGDLDPWSSAPSPARSSTPQREQREPAVEVSTGSADGLNALMGEPGDTIDHSHGCADNQILKADPPSQYTVFFDALDPSTTNELPLSSVHRLLSTSNLPAGTIEKVGQLRHLRSQQKIPLISSRLSPSPLRDHS